MLQGYINCFKELLETKDHPWRYLMTLQDHDFPLKTNREIVEILKLYDGANDVELIPPLESRYKNKWIQTLNEEGLGIGIEKTSTEKGPPPHGLKIYKGSVAAALSRNFLEFLVKDQRSLDFQTWLSDTALPDEYLWSTLTHNQKLKAPGNYPGIFL